jgi:RNA polymerase sigma-32 factor
MEITLKFYLFKSNTKKFSEPSYKAFIRQARQYEVPTRAEELALFRSYAAEKAPRVREEIINRNLRLVVSVASRYAAATEGHALMDAVQDGCIGLMRAIETFDPERGVRFLSYAVPWIRVHVGRGVVQHKGLVTGAKGNTIGRVPSPPVYSLDLLQRQDDGGAHTPDFLVRDHELQAAWSPENQIVANDQQVRVREALRFAVKGKKDKMAHAIINRRLLADEPETLQEIGDTFGVSRERIRQIEKKTVQRVKKLLERAGVAA